MIDKTIAKYLKEAEVPLHRRDSWYEMQKKEKLSWKKDIEIQAKKLSDMVEKHSKMESGKEKVKYNISVVRERDKLQKMRKEMDDYFGKGKFEA